MRNFEAEIDQFHSILNTEEVLPRYALRRNSLNYTYVSYLNIIVGCYLSRNLCAVPLFIECAINHTEENDRVSDEYKNGLN